jgi:hypothetical protein
MATLQQTLRGLPEADDQLSRGPGGTLQRTKKLQQAVKDTGVATAPTTPMGAQMIGADAQASKMAGTPQQMQATLQTALRRKQYGREATAEETTGMAKSVDMQKLGGLGDRVQSMVDSEAAKLKAPTLVAAVQGQPAVPTTPVVQVATTEEATKYADKLAVIKTNPQSQEAMDAMAEISRDLGKNPEDIDWNKMFQDAGTAIGAAAASTIMNAEDLPVLQILQDIGYQLPELSQLLGVPESELQGYNIKQLQDKINEVATTEFGKTQQLEQQAASPLVGAAQRGLAREAAREFSATGVRATEADMQRLNDSIAQADMVSFPPGTPQRPVAEALADDEISAMIKEIVESPEDSELRKQVEAQSPEFYAFIKGNELALKEAASRIDTGSTQFKQIQTANVQFIEGAGLSADAAKLFVPSAVGVQSKKVSAEDVPVVAYLNTIGNKVERKTISDTLNALATNDPDLAAEVAKLSKEQLISLGVGKPGSNWDKMLKHNATVDKVQQIPEDDVSGLLAEAYSDMPSPEVAQDYIARGNTLSALGLESGVALSSLDPATLKQNITASTGQKVSVEDAVAGNIPQVKKPAFGSPKEPDPASQEYLLYRTLSPILADGNLSAQEINDTKGPISKLGWDDLLKLQDMSKNPKSSMDRGALNTLLNKKREDNTSSLLRFRGVVPANSTKMATIDAYASLLDQDPRKVDHARVKQDLSKQLTAAFKDPKRSNVDFDKTIDRAKYLGVLTPDLINAINQAATSRYTSYIYKGATQTSIKNKQDTIETNLSLWNNGIQRGNYPYAWGIDANGNPRKSSADFNLPKVTLKRGNKTMTVSQEYAGRYETDGWKRV